ncbi:hypothetical protein SCHPADRAFT_897276 [Schizopora paradoxa]|uniref:Uncharacterized protein n=1 Tax=Schizopora paradoxa TaxID=27342 RepID=A0A0H2QX16_9AGAM|nr:hypothetical protein SCHPADRAFT_897276 [Schizopora paradoxa]
MVVVLLPTVLLRRYLASSLGLNSGFTAHISSQSLWYTSNFAVTMFTPPIRKIAKDAPPKTIPKKTRRLKTNFNLNVENDDRFLPLYKEDDEGDFCTVADNSFGVRDSGENVSTGTRVDLDKAFVKNRTSLDMIPTAPKEAAKARYGKFKPAIILEPKNMM